MEALEKFDYGDMCWWCSNPADSSEHKYKRSDIVSEFGRPPYGDGSSLIRVVRGRVVSDKLRGPASGHFKFPVGLCRRCNSTRSQPFDRAYQSLAAFIRLNEANIVQNESIDLAQVFGSDWQIQLTAVRQYLVKHACCRLAEAGFRIGSELLSFLDGRIYQAPFYLIAEIREDILEALGKGENRYGSLWIGDLVGWHEPENLRCRRVESHYGLGWLRFSWTYDSLARVWPDNMNAQRIPLAVTRNLLPTPMPAPISQAQLPVARPVPGKSGLVYSPYAKGKIIAVAGGVMGIPNYRIEFKHDEVVVCPYTGKKFRVP
jgi:hypothetical protein